MRRKLQAATVAVCLAGLATSALACLWDTDTLQMERRRFPGVLELISGKFVRHSQAYYEWRVQDRQQRLADNPGDPGLIDDLAVAYDKLGRQAEGIALLEECLMRHPDRYETLANLGTLLIHAGRFEEGKQFIERAIEVNPDAHFGREKYQKLLVEYVQQSDLDSAGVLSAKGRNVHDEPVAHFAGFVIGARFGTKYWSESGLSVEEWNRQRAEEIAAATKGVLGMMHFGNHRSPVLLEALGDLLIVGEPEENMTQLAALAYLRAARLANSPDVAERYRQMAREVLVWHDDFRSRDTAPAVLDLTALDEELDRRLEDGDSYFRRIEQHEQRWIAAGDDVDAQFAARYYDSLDETIAEAEQQLQTEPLEVRRSHREQNKSLALAAIGILCAVPMALTAVIIALLFCWPSLLRRAVTSKADAVTKPSNP